jgi:hypothetical protein
VLAAHNAPFDLGFLTAGCRSAGLTWPQAAVLDTAVLARLVLGTDQVPDCKLTTLAQFFATPNVPCHRALADAQATADVLRGLLAMIGAGRRPVGEPARHLARGGSPTGDPAASGSPASGSPASGSPASGSPASGSAADDSAASGSPADAPPAATEPLSAGAEAPPAGAEPSPAGAEPPPASAETPSAGAETPPAGAETPPAGAEAPPPAPWLAGPQYATAAAGARVPGEPRRRPWSPLSS